MLVAYHKFGPHYLAQARTLLAELKKIEVVFNEHGFHVDDSFLQLRELEEASEPILPSAE